MIHTQVARRQHVKCEQQQHTVRGSCRDFVFPFPFPSFASFECAKITRNAIKTFIAMTTSVDNVAISGT